MEQLKVILDLLSSSVKLSILNVILELNISDILINSHKLEDIKNRLGFECDIEQLSLLMNAVVSAGFAVKKDGHYHNSRIANELFLSTGEFCIEPLIKGFQLMQIKSADSIINQLKNGNNINPQELPLSGNKAWDNAAKILDIYQKTGVGYMVADAIQSTIDFCKINKMLDVGCGSGFSTIEIMKNNQELQAVLLDLPPTITYLRNKNDIPLDIRDRMSFLEGDYNDIAFGSEYDLVFASLSLNFAKDKKNIFKKIFNSLNKNGVFISLHEGVTEEETSPEPIILSRLSMMLERTSLFFFNYGEIENILSDIGFVDIKTKPFNSPMGKIYIVTGKKGGNE